MVDSVSMGRKWEEHGTDILLPTARLAVAVLLLVDVIHSAAYV
jgi:hypothetical protein